MLVPAKLGHVDGPRAAPVLLEDEIGDDAGRDRERHQHEYDGATGNDQRPAWLHEFERQREHYRHGDERDQPNRDITGAQIDRIVGAPESAHGIVEQRGEFEIEVGPDAEDETDPGGDDKRNQEAGSGHAADPRAALAEQPREFKSAPHNEAPPNFEGRDVL